MYFRTNDSDQLGIGVWSMKPTTKLSSKYADLRPTGNGKGICRADLPQNMSVNVQSKLYYTPYISLYVWIMESILSLL